MAGFSDFGGSQTPNASADELVFEGDFFDHDDSFKPNIPEGRFLVKVDSVESKHNPTSNAYGLVWKITVVEGPAAGKSLQNGYYTYIGKKIGNRISEDQNGGSTRRMFRTLGITPELEPTYFDENKKMRLPKDAVINRQFYATFAHKKEKSNTSDEMMTFVNVVKVEPHEQVGSRFAGTVVPEGGIPTTF